MADNKTLSAPIPPHTVRHVDGVMHLTLETTQATAPVTEALRFEPPSDPSEEA